METTVVGFCRVAHGDAFLQSPWYSDFFKFLNSNPAIFTNDATQLKKASTLLSMPPFLTDKIQLCNLVATVRIKSDVPAADVTVSMRGIKVILPLRISINTSVIRTSLMIAKIFSLSLLY